MFVHWCSTMNRALPTHAPPSAAWSKVSGGFAAALSYSDKCYLKQWASPVAKAESEGESMSPIVRPKNGPLRLPESPPELPMGFERTLIWVIQRFSSLFPISFTRHLARENLMWLFERLGHKFWRSAHIFP